MARPAGRLLLAGLGALGVLSNPNLGYSASPGGSTVLYFFTTPEAEGGPEGARRAVAFSKKYSGRVTLRPVLLVRDFKSLKGLTEKSNLARTVKELEVGRKPGTLDIPLYDEEGLHLAERWEIRAVPAFVLVNSGRAHRMAGASADLELLWECRP